MCKLVDDREAAVKKKKKESDDREAAAKKLGNKVVRTKKGDT